MKTRKYPYSKGYFCIFRKRKTALVAADGRISAVSNEKFAKSYL